MPQGYSLSNTRSKKAAGCPACIRRYPLVDYIEVLLLSSIGLVTSVTNLL